MKVLFGLFLCAILLPITHDAWAQGFVENALLFSRTRPGGSARIQSLGGAQVALGGDFSSALSNPAGLGIYNRSEITFSPALNTYKTDAEHVGTKSSDSKDIFNIPGASYVHHMPVEKNGFLGGSFGVSMTRVNDFNGSFQYSGEDNASSIVDYFEERAYGYSINELPSPYQDTPLLSFDIPEGMAYLTYLITPINEDPTNTDPVLPDDYITYFSDLDTLGGEIRTLDRYQKVTTQGAQYQWSFAYGGNFNDKMFFGASIGVTSLRYKFSTTYEESNYRFSTDPLYDPLDYLQLKEDIVIDGTGINLTLGLIYRPLKFAQIGVSFVTPTYYELSDSYSAQLKADWNPSAGYGLREVISNPIVSEYNITTPLKLSVGTAIFIGKYGFITSDVEFVNYNKAKYDSNTPGVSFDPENDDIQYYYTNVINYRVGLELRYSMFRLRGGGSIQSNPYKKTFDVDRAMTTLSTGAGIKLNKFFVDVAWLVTKGDSSFSPYVFQDGSGTVASLRNKTTSGMLTVGLTF